MNYTFYNEDTDTEQIWDVDYKISRYDPGSRRGHPDNWYPAEGGEMESMEVFDENGVDITHTLSPKTLKDISDECYMGLLKFKP